MGRERHQGPYYVTLPITCGTKYYDYTYPYGDGPWTGSDQKWPNPWDTSTRDYAEGVVFDEIHPGPPYKSGGPFNLYRFYTDEYVLGGAVSTTYSLARYVGSHLISRKPSAFLGFANLAQYMQGSGDDDIESYGAIGWNRFRPTRSGADLGTFLGEIHEVPRMFRTTAKGFSDLWRSMGGSRGAFAPKKVANHWLNHQFGWLPFLSDLRQFYNTAKRLDSKLKQLRRDNGSWIRRGGTIAADEDTEVLDEGTDTPSLWPVADSLLLQHPYGDYQVTRTTTRNIWFEGAFRYYIPGDTTSWAWNARATAMLFGAYPSPSLVWELTPWSWLIDWCSNVGDVIANVSSIGLDNLAAKYAYVMGHTRRSVSSTGSLNYRSGLVTMTREAFFESKVRLPASPFGFGLTSDDFSARQWSILGALGLSRHSYT